MNTDLICKPPSVEVCPACRGSRRQWNYERRPGVRTLIVGSMETCGVCGGTGKVMPIRPLGNRMADEAKDRMFGGEAVKKEIGRRL